MDKQTKSKLQYTLVQLESSLDNPSLESYLLLKLRKLYEDSDTAMPPKIKAFYVREVKRIVKHYQDKLSGLREQAKEQQKDL